MRPLPDKFVLLQKEFTRLKELFVHCDDVDEKQQLLREISELVHEIDVYIREREANRRG